MLDEDITDGTPAQWLVIGWFTADYRPLAETFSANLAEHAIPHHLFARPKLAKGWNTLQKPDVVLDAMDRYPDKTLILMDVDCIVKGDIAPVAQLDADIGITVLAHHIPDRGRGVGYVGVQCSSRVVVFRPTDQARRFAQAWRTHIEGPTGLGHDEHAMMWAILTSLPVTSFAYIDQRYSGREIGWVSDPVISHDSAHEHDKRRDEAWFKTFERRFRSGRSKVRKAGSDLSVTVKRLPQT